jgi:hypothetical protein
MVGVLVDGARHNHTAGIFLVMRGASASAADKRRSDTGI